jgi:hypothetical protein
MSICGDVLTLSFITLQVFKHVTLQPTASSSTTTLESYCIPFTHFYITITLCRSAEILFSTATAFSIAVTSHAYYRQKSVHFQDANSMNSGTVLHPTTFIGVINIQNILVTHSAADKEL